MFESESHILINDHLESVFQIAERYPEFVNFYEKKSILYQDDNKLLIEIKCYLFGIPFRWKGEGIKNRYKEIKFEQTDGLLKGLKAHWLFDKKNGWTKVSIKTKFSINNPAFKILEKSIGNFIVKKITDKILIALRTESEMRQYTSQMG